jgi:hypothetical protein
MKNLNRKVTLMIIFAGMAIYWGCGENPKPATEAATANSSRLPQDVKMKCTVSQDTFNTWFVNGKPSENGTVRPANSVTFPHINNCSFYTWSEQMFLWITSPVSGGKYVPGNTVLESPVFYDVTTVNDSNQRFLVQHKPGVPLHANAHINQEGPNKLPVIIDKEGRVFEVETDANTNKKPLLKNAMGKQEQVTRIEAGPAGTHIFKNAAGKVIEHPKAIIQHEINPSAIVHEFKLGNESVYLDAAGNEISTEVGQATGNVLMAQNHALVYYISMVNDVYAYFLTGSRNNQMSGYQFPTTPGARDSICAIARKSGATLPDSNALAIELKTSWVEVTNLPNENTYLIVDAMVPTYDTSNRCKWVPNGERKTKLALIGIHIVGSVAGHPEMSWATFEHLNNAPNAAYKYVNNKNETVTVPQETGKGWLLTADNASGSFNIPYMTNKGDTVLCDSPYKIAPSNTLLAMPWGSAMDSITNPEDTTSAASNSEIIGMNNTILKMLAGNDLRKNYLLIGATWTSGGAIPNGKSYSRTNTAPGVAIGASVLANSTMETYIQRPTTSCFLCHHKNDLAPASLSHIFKEIQPLPAVPRTMK